MVEKTATGRRAKRGSYVRSLAKALEVIDLLANSNEDMRLGEIAKRLQLPKSTVYGILNTLRDKGYVDQSPFDGRYRLGVRLFEVGSSVARRWDVYVVAGPFIQKLLEEFGETVHLVMLDKGEVLYIDKRETRQSLRIVSQVGMRLPAHCTGVGKVLLAHLPESEVRRIVAEKGLKVYTPNTISSLPRLLSELEKIREQGYAVDNEEIMQGLRCVAAPVRNHEGRVIAAISISGPVSRISGERFTQAVNLVTETAGNISRALGFRDQAELGTPV